MAPCARIASTVSANGMPRGISSWQVEADHLAGRRLHLGADDHVQRQAVLRHVRLRVEPAGDGVVVGDRDRAESELERAVDEVGHRRLAVGRVLGVHVEVAEDAVGAGSGSAGGRRGRGALRVERLDALCHLAGAIRRRRRGEARAQRLVGQQAAGARRPTSAGCPSWAISPDTSCSTPYEPGLPATATIGMPQAAASRAISGLPLRAGDEDARAAQRGGAGGRRGRIGQAHAARQAAPARASAAAALPAELQQRDLGGGAARARGTGRAARRASPRVASTATSGGDVAGVAA